MKKLSLYALAFVSSLFSISVFAADIQVERATVRATAPGQQTAMLDMQIISKQAGHLISVSTPAAKSVELHRMSHESGMMMMREVDAINLPAGQVVDLGEAGFHVMLMDIKAPIKVGSSIPFVITIKLDNNRSVKVKAQAEVTPLVEIKPEADEHMHMHHH